MIATEATGARWPSRSSKPAAASVRGRLGSTPRRFRHTRRGPSRSGRDARGLRQVQPGSERNRRGVEYPAPGTRGRSGSKVVQSNQAGRRGARLLNQADVASPRAFLRIFLGELDALPFTKQLEHRASHRTAVEEVLNAGLVPDEPEPLVDEESCDRPGLHTRILRFQVPGNVPETAAPADTGGIRLMRPERGRCRERGELVSRPLSVGRGNGPSQVYVRRDVPVYGVCRPRRSTPVGAEGAGSPS